MKFKTAENLPFEAALNLREAGFLCETVWLRLCRALPARSLLREYKKKAGYWSRWIWIFRTFRRTRPASTSASSCCGQRYRTKRLFSLHPQTDRPPSRSNSSARTMDRAGRSHSGSASGLKCHADSTFLNRPNFRIADDPLATRTFTLRGRIARTPPMPSSRTRESADGGQHQREHNNCG